MIKILLTIFWFFHFTNNTNPRESRPNKKSILIGDSNVSVIKSTRGFREGGINPTVWRVGISTRKLIGMLRGTKPDSSITTVFVAIGTNDGYIGDISSNLKLQLIKTYPNAKELYVIWGSRGWGGVKHSTVDQQSRFYRKFEESGFKQIRVTTGQFSNSNSAHLPNSPFFLEIVNKITLIVKKGHVSYQLQSFPEQ